MVGPNTEGRPAAFLGRHFQDQIILLCVRWYLRFASHCGIWKSSWRNGFACGPDLDQPGGGGIRRVSLERSLGRGHCARIAGGHDKGTGSTDTSTDFVCSTGFRQGPTMRVQTEVSRYRIGDFLRLKVLDDNSSAKPFLILKGRRERE